MRRRCRQPRGVERALLFLLVWRDLGAITRLRGVGLGGLQLLLERRGARARLRRRLLRRDERALGVGASARLGQILRIRLLRAGRRLCRRRAGVARQELEPLRLVCEPRLLRSHLCFGVAMLRPLVRRLVLLL